MNPTPIILPRPQITTGPKGVPVDEATADYLTEAAARVRANRYWGSGVSTCVATLLDHAAAALRGNGAGGYIDVVFDGPPSHESGRFVEVEDARGASIAFGEWVERPDGMWALRIPHGVA